METKREPIKEASWSGKLGVLLLQGFINTVLTIYITALHSAYTGVTPEQFNNWAAGFDKRTASKIEQEKKMLEDQRQMEWRLREFQASQEYWRKGTIACIAIVGAIIVYFCKT